MTEEPKFLFVYGTLREGADHSAHRLLKKGAKLIGPARMRGQLYKVDSYPGAVLSDSGDEHVFGELYQLQETDSLLAMLDDYEEAGKKYPEPQEYRRCQVMVELKDGAKLCAWCYLYNRATVGLKLITSGDWCGEPSEDC